MILVTGGTGLVGSHLLYDLVSSGKKVRALRRAGSDVSAVERTFSYYTSNAKQLARQIEWVEGDMTDPYSLLDAMEGVEQVYHSAAIVSFEAGNERTMIQSNVEGTANVVNAAMEKKVKKLCHVSSVAALGNSERGELITEESYWRSSPSNTGYAISKYGAEREVWRGIEEGLCAVIVNPSIVIGPGPRSSSRMLHAVHKGLRFYPQGSSGWVDVRDVSKAMIRLMESEIKSERYILNEGNYTFYEFFSAAAQSMGKSKPSVKVGRLLGGIGWRLIKVWALIRGKKPSVTRQSLRSSLNKNSYSSEKIKKAIGFQFIPLEQSLNDTVQRLGFINGTDNGWPSGQRIYG